MSWDLSGRTALITGAASGIGAALAGALAQRGMRLGLSDRDAAGLASVAERLPGAVTEVADVCDRGALDTAIEDVVERLPPPPRSAARARGQTPPARTP